MSVQIDKGNATTFAFPGDPALLPCFLLCLSCQNPAKDEGREEADFCERIAFLKYRFHQVFTCFLLAAGGLG